jgi:GMP synthase-like glutamine amidotransferase
VIERETLPQELVATAWTADGTIMAVAHRSWPLVGLQFHPEAILTDRGYDLLAAFLSTAGIAPPAPPPRIESERVTAAEVPAPLPLRPVTF